MRLEGEGVSMPIWVEEAMGINISFKITAHVLVTKFVDGSHLLYKTKIG